MNHLEKIEALCEIQAGMPSSDNLHPEFEEYLISILKLATAHPYLIEQVSEVLQLKFEEYLIYGLVPNAFDWLAIFNNFVELKNQLKMREREWEKYYNKLEEEKSELQETIWKKEGHIFTIYFLLIATPIVFICVYFSLKFINWIISLF